MEGVLTRTTTGRPGVAAVGALLVVCLVGAPLMSLFPVAVWELALSLGLGRPELETLLVTPVAVGGTVLMVLISALVLRGTGVRHPAACACLAAGTALATPLVMALLSPTFTPVPGDALVNAAVVSAVVASAAVCACVLLGQGHARHGVLPGMAVAAVGLLLLPLAAEHTRDRSTERRSISQISEFGHTIAVLDHPKWAPVGVHEVHGGLRMTYVAGDGADPLGTVPERKVPPRSDGSDEAPDSGRPGPPATGEVAGGPGVGADRADENEPGSLHVLSWTPEQRESGIHGGCGFPAVECSEQDSMVVVHRDADGHPPRLSEVRTRLDDGSVASVHPSGAVAPELLFTVARTLRAEAPGERAVLIEEVLRG